MNDSPPPARRRKPQPPPFNVRCDQAVLRPLLGAVTSATGETQGRLFVRLLSEEARKLGVEAMA